MVSSVLPGSGSVASAEVLALLADTLPWPLLLLRRDGILVHGNLAARQVLRAGYPLQLTTLRRVVPSSTRDQGLFSDALQNTGPESRILRWQGPQGLVTATLTLLAAAEGDAGAMPSVLVALATHPGRGAEVRAFAQWHGLSDAESRVLEHLAQGQAGDDIAAELGISSGAVRSRIVSVRRKTGHASVPDLMRTLASLPPLGGPPC